jgi:hypothetical protein
MNDLIKKRSPHTAQTADLPLRTKGNAENQANNSLFGVFLWPLVVSEAACSGWNSSATDPLHPNSNEINVPSGVAERPAFFVKLRRSRGVPSREPKS